MEDFSFRARGSIYAIALYRTFASQSFDRAQCGWCHASWLGRRKHKPLPFRTATGACVNVEESYSELGLHPDCSDAEIKTAWRRLAARWHPDRNASPQALRKIQRINRALDEIRRARASLRDEADEGDEGDEAPAAERPEPEHRVELTLEEALAGCTRILHGTLVEDCEDCDATGIEPQASNCQACGGTGRARQHLWFAWLTPPARCEACKGSGSTRHACAACKGVGHLPPTNYRCRVDIPAGSRDADVLKVSVRLQGAGGDRSETLRVRLVLQPHEFFTLDADGTVQCELPVDGFAWMANRWIEVPTPGGLQQMRLRRGFLTYRIKGQGCPTGSGGERADCMVTVDPLFPEELGREQETLVNRLVASNSGSARTDAGERVAAWRQRIAGWQSRVGR
jgi:molecular chaperone DnaJ